MSPSTGSTPRMGGSDCPASIAVHGTSRRWLLLHQHVQELLTAENHWVTNIIPILEKSEDSPRKITRDNELIVAGLEIYTSKSALQDQLNDPTFFQPFEKLVVEQQLCYKKETMLAWYLAAGFLARSQEKVAGGGGVVVRIHQMTCAGSGEREAVIEGLGEFAGWSRGSDVGVLTFALFTRKKAAREVLAYVRYRDEGAMRRIEGRSEYQNIWRLVAPLLVTEESKESVWREVDDSFVWPVSHDVAKL